MKSTHLEGQAHVLISSRTVYLELPTTVDGYPHLPKWRATGSPRGIERYYVQIKPTLFMRKGVGTDRGHQPPPTVFAKLRNYRAQIDVTLAGNEIIKSE